MEFAFGNFLDELVDWVHDAEFEVEVEVEVEVLFVRVSDDPRSTDCSLSPAFCTPIPTVSGDSIDSTSLTYE
jgi:hypothetical protein